MKIPDPTTTKRKQVAGARLVLIDPYNLNTLQSHPISNVSRHDLDGLEQLSSPSMFFTIRY